MPLIEWEDKYSVGVNKFDIQHKVLIDSINNLFETMMTILEEDTPHKVIVELTNYANIHFDAEEKAMAEFGYPDTEAHIEEHHFFKQKISEFEKDKKNSVTVITFNIFNFMRTWIMHHILIVDKKYTSFFNKKGLK